MDSNKKYPEVNLWSVSWGIAMAILFSAAAAYLGLKVGQVFEAAIPIAIIAVGVSGAAKRKGALGENVIIQSIGASSGVIVAGAIFTLPALYILQESYPKEITVTFTQVFISSCLLYTSNTYFSCLSRFQAFVHLLIKKMTGTGNSHHMFTSIQTDKVRQL